MSEYVNTSLEISVFSCNCEWYCNKSLVILVETYAGAKFKPDSVEKESKSINQNIPVYLNSHLLSKDNKLPSLRLNLASLGQLLDWSTNEFESL